MDAVSSLFEGQNLEFASRLVLEKLILSNSKDLVHHIGRLLLLSIRSELDFRKYIIHLVYYP